MDAKISKSRRLESLSLTPLPPHLSTVEVAKLLGISRDSTERLVRSKKIPFFRFRRQVRIFATDAQAYVDKLIAERDRNAKAA